MNQKGSMAVNQFKSIFALLASVMGGCAIGLSQPLAIAQGPNREMPTNSAPPAIDPSFPESVKEAVLQSVAKETGLQPDRFRLTQATSKIWSDGCLGLGPPAQMCTAVLVQGWEVRVANQRQEWVYRTNSSGEAVKLDPAGSRLSQTIAPPAEQTPSDRQPPRLEKKVVFREIRSGGFAGITQVTSLYRDGRLAQKSSSPGGERVLRTLSKAEVKAFKKRLEKLHFGQFDRLRYPAPKGAADYFNVTLSNGQTTVQYADINLEDAPQDLKLVVRAWQALTTP
jgi:hypothetical protein